MGRVSGGRISQWGAARAVRWVVAGGALFWSGAVAFGGCSLPTAGEQGSQCSTDLQCSDGKRCTQDQCVDGQCVSTPVLEGVPDDEDPCQACTGKADSVSKPDETPCAVGSLTGQCENGQCVIECGSDAAGECPPPSSGGCTRWHCNVALGVCERELLHGLEAPEQVDRNCRLETCVDGGITSEIWSSSDGGSCAGGAGGTGGSGGGPYEMAMRIVPRRVELTRWHLALADGSDEPRAASVRIRWEPASAAPVPFDLAVELPGSKGSVLQIFSVGDRPLARAGLRVVPLEPQRDYRIDVVRRAEAAWVELMDLARGRVVLTTTATPLDRARRETATLVLPTRGTHVLVLDPPPGGGRTLPAHP